MTNLQIPDQLANQILEEAKAEGTTVPDLLEQMLHEHRQAKRKSREHSAAITAQLDTVYAKEQSSLDPNLSELQSRSL
jgi:Na+/phosphate symporter